MKFKACAFLFMILFIYGCQRDAAVNEPDTGLPPAVPAGLQVVASHDGSVLIDWKPNAEPALKGYYVYRGVNDSVSFKKIFFTSDSYFYDDSLSYDTTYYYKVSAVDDNGKESRQTYFVRARPVNLNAPREVNSLEVNARNWLDSLSVFLKWDPNTEGDISGYEVYRSESPGFTPGIDNLVGTAQGLTFLDTHNLKPYVTYYYKVIALDKGGLKSTPGNEVSDMILGLAEAVFPNNGSRIDYFNNFVIKAISAPANYRIVLQSNLYFGEIWSRSFSSNKTNDTIQVKIDGVQLNTNTVYYWRIITYSSASSEPNSISALYNFTIRP
ncbi:MAG: fibronectin type III domain-containing protein [Syntrophomonadaceae bacterium]